MVEVHRGRFSEDASEASTASAHSMGQLGYLQGMSPAWLWQAWRRACGHAHEELLHLRGNALASMDAIT